MKKMEQSSPGIVRAAKILEQAKARYEEEKRKANAKRRKAENHHKYMMGGIIVKYFPDCYQYEESELNEILAAALAAEECKAAVKRVQAAAADSMDAEKDGSGYADKGETENSRYAGQRKTDGGGYADLKNNTIVGGGSYGQEM